jgi:hypothetical protein
MSRLLDFFGKTRKLACIANNEVYASGKNISESFEDLQKKKVLISSWEDLQGKNILNKNVLIRGFGDIHPFFGGPFFPNAKNVFFYDNYKYFHYYWINKNIFPGSPNIFINGHHVTRVY